MIPLDSAPLILLVSMLVLVSASLVTLAFGRKLLRNGDWLIGVGLFILSAALFFSGRGLWENGFKAKPWLRGWVWPADSSGAITIGVLSDGVGLVMSLLAVAVAVLLLSHRSLLRGLPRLERYYSSVGLCATGASLAWLSLTPWLSFFGLGLAALGGFLSLGSRWEKCEEASVAVRFAWEKLAGMALAIFGACGIAGTRNALIWGEAPGAWGGAGASTADWVGGALLVAGIFAQFQPFPLLGGTVASSRTRPWVRITLSQLLPAWAAFAILLRAEPELRAMGVFPSLGWPMAICVLLTFITSFCQSEWKQGLSTWVASGFSLAATVLAFSGGRTAFSLFLGLSLGILAFTAATSSILVQRQSENTEEAVPEGDRSVIFKTLSVIAMCAATGVVGFVAAGGGVGWIVQSLTEQPGLAAVAAFLVFCFALLGWKLLWTTVLIKKEVAADWSEILVPCLPILVGLGVLWTGSVTGGAAPAGTDQVMPSLLNLLFPAVETAQVSELVFVPASGLYWGALLAAIFVAYWVATRVNAPEADDDSGKARVFRFLASGYRIDSGASRAIAGLTWVVSRVQQLIEIKIWNTWLPQGFTTAIGRTSALLVRADTALADRSRDWLRVGVETPAKLLQAVQNGDVQWYLVFAIGSGLVILFHFLGFGG